MARNKQSPKSTGHPAMDRLVKGVEESLSNGNQAAGIMSHTPAATLGASVGGGHSVSQGHSHLNGALLKQFDDALDE